MTSTTRTVQVYRIYIQATPEAVWTAITAPEWSERYGTARPPTTSCAPAAGTAASRARR
ncbi:hypothetical protein GCM10023176_43160 [Micromonospora coerulea]|uniref:Polyketide cyclase / dehydrase and lipid transport n=1 Tax=Micromonospora coerulea TaxID=47856 RepID=A0ABP8SW82_9ACTN